MVLFPNAKINIGLNILRKRGDGYHDIETLFYPIGLKDALEYVDNGGNQVRLVCTGLPIEVEQEQNIVVKAYRILQEEHKLPGLDIHLHKVIPSGAGLGGGSADAAFFLKSLNEHFELNISESKLKVLVGKLGADCSFFLENKPAYATGTGEILSTVDLSLKGYYLLLVKPSFGVDTKMAYAGVQPAAYPFKFMEIILGRMNGWQEKIRNDFEPSLFVNFPELGILKQKLSDLGATYVSMSGSGSSVFGIFKEEPVLPEDYFSPGTFIWQEELS
jgi:4-diphosphocytidyl-2-C-methyl-D-erythritol kinase